jgi:hypothetical protein
MDVITFGGENKFYVEADSPERGLSHTLRSQPPPNFIAHAAHTRVTQPTLVRDRKSST